MKFNEKLLEMREKYKKAIEALAETNNVAIDVAQDMLEANILKGASYPYVNEEEFKKDFEELIHAEK